jgi:hypothetical protein
MGGLFSRIAGPRGLRPIWFIHSALKDFPGLVLIRLKAGQKVPINRFTTARTIDHNLNGPDERSQTAACWLAGGNNVGIVIHRAGVWVLDLDASDPLPENIAAKIERLSPPQVRTPSGGCHCYFRLPDDLVDHPDLKAHVNLRKVPGVHLEADLKLGGRQTLVVAPGSRKSDGSSYEVTRPWSMPPVLDPRDLFAQAPIFHPRIDPKERKEFLTDNRSLDARIVRATRYLAKAPASVSGSGGRTRLFQVCTHLCSFLRLKPKLAYELLTHPEGQSWNDRCVDGVSGDAYPWSKAELMHALEAGQHAVPAYGVILHERQKERMAREAKITKACKVIRKHNKGGTVPVPIRLIYEMAIASMGIGAEHCTITRFGRMLRRLNVKRIRHGASKVWSLNLRHGIERLQSDLQRTFLLQGGPDAPLEVEALQRGSGHEGGPS